MRSVYRFLLDGAKHNLQGLLEISDVEAGLQTAGWLSGGIDGELGAAAAAKRDVEVIPLSLYGSGRVARGGLQLGFAAVDVKEIRRGVRDLAIAPESECRDFRSAIPDE